MKKILFVFGTRPEAIKMAPMVRTFKAESTLDVKVCVTGQHREMLDQVLEFFEITPDFDLNLMKPNQTLFDITANALMGLKEIFSNYVPDIIFVQGDTTTAFVGSLAGFYQNVKVAHLEAGLRSGNKLSPWPEEVNRILTGHIANYHFAPTPRAKANLENESISDNIWVVGNTVIDALFMGLDIIKKKGEDEYRSFFNFVDFSKKLILVTGHRRESFGGPFEDMCSAMKEIVEAHDDVEIIYPVHLNPNVQEPVKRLLSGVGRIHLIEPLSYPYLIWLMSQSHIVLTDSGGIQEEAPSLGKPVLVMRDVTERTEGIDSGTAKLVGTDKEVIVREMNKLLTDKDAYNSMSKAVNPYGKGDTSKQIVTIITSS